MAAEGPQCPGHVGVQFELAEGVEIALDPPRIAMQAAMGEGLAERQFGDVAVAAVRLPVMGDIALLPVFEEFPSHRRGCRPARPPGSSGMRRTSHRAR
jgi:hypothetical protein